MWLDTSFAAVSYNGRIWRRAENQKNATCVLKRLWLERPLLILVKSSAGRNPDCVHVPAMDTSSMGRCVFFLILALIFDVVGLILFFLGIFAPLSFWDFFVLSGPLLIFLSLVFWIFWYLGSLTVPYEELILPKWHPNMVKGDPPDQWLVPWTDSLTLTTLRSWQNSGFWVFDHVSHWTVNRRTWFSLKKVWVLVQAVCVCFWWWWIMMKTWLLFQKIDILSSVQEPVGPWNNSSWKWRMAYSLFYPYDVEWQDVMYRQPEFHLCWVEVGHEL